MSQSSERTSIIRKTKEGCAFAGGGATEWRCRPVWLVGLGRQHDVVGLARTAAVTTSRRPSSRRADAVALGRAFKANRDSASPNYDRRLSFPLRHLSSRPVWSLPHYRARASPPRRRPALAFWCCQGAGGGKSTDNSTKPCSMCNGSGRISCPVCESEGVVGRTIRCPYCGGRKTMVCPLCVEDVYEASWEPRAPPLGSEEEDDPELAGIEDERVRGLYRSTRDHLRHSHEAQQREDNAPAEEGQ